MVLGSSPLGFPPTPSDNNTHRCVMSCSGAQQPEGLSGGGLSWLRTDKDAEREGSLDTEALAGNLRLTRDLD